jgi:hypothetical protein
MPLVVEKWLEKGHANLLEALIWNLGIDRKVVGSDQGDQRAGT